MTADSLRESLLRLNATPPVEVARMAAHDAFDPIWQSGFMSRTDAYRWLAKAMGLPAHKAHMEQFDAEQCARVVRLVRESGF